MEGVFSVISGQSFACLFGVGMWSQKGSNYRERRFFGGTWRVGFVS